jgi:outer membrane protein OmpA-like peptidoglycan-associated protein
MATSILDGVLSMVTPEMKQALASRLGESPTAVQSGLGTAAAATLGGLVSKSGDTSFLNQIIGLVSGSSGQGILSNLSSIASTGTTSGISDIVSRFLPMVFGGQQNQVTNLMTQRAGISPTAASSLLQTAVPLILGFFAKLHASGSLNTSSLANMLTAEGPNLQKFLPTGFLSNFSSTAAGASSRMVAAEHRAEDRVKGMNWMAVLGVLVALFVVWFVYRALEGSKTSTTTAVASNVVGNAASNAATTASNAWASLGSFYKTTLPDGTELNIPQYGVENKLIAFIQDNSKPVDTNTWFDFDRLLFDTGSATLQPASDEQLRNIAEIMKAYPNVKIKISGYTDNTGDKAANQKLSADRANNVLAELEKLGVAPDRLEAQGYGEDHPVADNTTDEGKQKNRRISLRVTAK